MNAAQKAGKPAAMFRSLVRWTLPGAVFELYSEKTKSFSQLVSIANDCTIADRANQRLTDPSNCGLRLAEWIPSLGRMGGRGIFAITLAMGGAILAGVGLEIWMWFHQRDAGMNPRFPLGDRLFSYGFPPERYRSGAIRAVALGSVMFAVAMPAVVLARVS